MNKEKHLLEERSKTRSEVLSLLFYDYTNSSRIQEQLGKKSSFITNYLCALRNKNLLEDKRDIVKIESGKLKGKIRTVYLWRLKSEFIFKYYLDRLGKRFKQKEKEYLIYHLDCNFKFIDPSTKKNRSLNRRKDIVRYEQDIEQLCYRLMRVLLIETYNDLLNEEFKKKYSKKFLISVLKKLVKSIKPHIKECFQLKSNINTAEEFLSKKS